MKTAFGDTSYWRAVLDPRDHLHVPALQITQTLQKSKVVTSELVLIELLNGVSGGHRLLRREVSQFVWRLRDDVNVRIIPVSTAQFQSALTLYERMMTNSGASSTAPPSSS